ncbi:MAG: hypothetical protein CL670_06525 [Balneola sp.]|jgi:hypothetical protein|nr:hypothetical protein [Balneola sp.]MAL18910.1 hypothetical protein [Balneola sp.]MBE78793.1 hypothetical protein [Balneola sp.]|tara:strand:+ start:291 stop:737 length:447 start_codon:yes stop_codon:yes gene_type:complete
MKISKAILLLTLISTFTLTGCFHATVETGKAASNEVIEQPWALSFVYGLIPPATVDASEKCTNGVAKVETQISFLNGLVSAITFSLVTPMNIKVTCAAGGGMANDITSPSENTVTLSKDASVEETKEAYQKATDLAIKKNETVFIQYN